MPVSVFLDRTNVKVSTKKIYYVRFGYTLGYSYCLCVRQWTKAMGGPFLVSAVHPWLLPSSFLPDNGQRRWEDRSWFRVFNQHMSRVIRRRLELCIYSARCKAQTSATNIITRVYLVILSWQGNEPRTWETS